MLRTFRRTLVALLLAALIPAAAFTTYQLVHLAQLERRDAQSAMLDQAHQILALTNARLTADLSILQTLAQSPSIDEGRFDVFRTLARRIADLNAGWLQVVLVDAASDQQVMNLLRPLSDMPRPALAEASYRRVKETLEPVIGGVFPVLEYSPEHVVVVRVPVLRDGKLRYVLSAGLKTQLFQELLTSQLPGEGVIAAGIVDRDAVFLARSRDPQLWIGKRATEYVQRAIATGRSGIYVGRLHEGIENYTAFAASPFSGWSVHVALDAAMLDAPRQRSRLLAAIAAGACLALLGALVVLVFREHRESRRAEAQFRQMQRLDALGKMTGGIAHDFNNLLAIIIGNVEVIRRRMGANTPVQVERIAQGAERGEKLIRQMLAFARRQPLNPQVTDLNDLIRAMLEILKRGARGDITLALELAQDLWPVEVDPVQLESALLNLVINARDAMPKGGTMVIATRNLPGETAAEGDLVELSVRDTGSGIAPEILERVFDPFFTTKAPGQGTGLGLSMVHGFVGQSGGRVDIESTVGIGTLVRLRLPRTRRRPERAAVRKSPARLNRGDGKILIVEDNFELREMTASWLEELGYTVHRAGTPAEAFERLKSFTPDLVFSDIVMPGGMNGVEFVREVRRRNPHVAVLLTTGHAAALGTVGHGEFQILQKPYHLDALAETVQRILEGRGREAAATGSAVG